MLKRYALVPAEHYGSICSTGFCVLRPDTEQIHPSFLFYLLGTSSFYAYIEANERGASYPAISNRAVKEARVPVPPLRVQHEIIQILNHFTGLNSELEERLEMELEARRKQYEYYRDRLLSFEEAAS